MVLLAFEFVQARRLRLLMVPVTDSDKCCGPHALRHS